LLSVTSNLFLYYLVLNTFIEIFLKHVRIK
jgi:hypothetical protein